MYVRQPSTQFVNVIVNGVSRGVYILSESIKDGNHRIPVSTSGFITEIDVYYWADLDAPHIFSNIIRNIAYTFKYPDEEDFTEERLDTIADFLHTVEQNFRKVLIFQTSLMFLHLRRGCFRMIFWVLPIPLARIFLW